MAQNRLPSLTDLVALGTLQALQDNFAKALGLSAQILDLQGRSITEDRFNSKFLNDLCTTKNAHASKAAESMRVHIYECSGRIFWFVAPIVLEGRVIALLKGGQVRLGNPELSVCKERAVYHNVPFERYLEEYLRLPLFTRERLEAAADLLKLVASTISSMAFAGISAEHEVEEVKSLNELLEVEVERKTRDLRISEARYRSLLDNADDVIYTVNSEGVITSINAAVQSITGYASSEIVGKHFKDFVHEEDFFKVANSFRDILAGGKSGTQGLEFRLNHKKGGVRWVQLNSRAIMENGEFIEIEGVLRDITKRFNENRRSAELGQKYDAIFNEMAYPLFIVDETSTCLFANQPLLDLLGYSSASELEGRSMLRFLSQHVKNALVERAVEISRQGDFRSTVFPLVFLTHEGTECPGVLHVSALGESSYFVIVEPTLSDRKSASQLRSASIPREN